MPYSQNQRYGFCEIKLNTSWVQEAIEEMGYEYKEKGRLSEEMTEFLHMYVRLLEVAFNKFINFHKKVDFDEWFLENYYSSENCAMFDKLFMGNEESEESEESEDEDADTCSKCAEKVPKNWVNECWAECVQTGWYCPAHSPTTNCSPCDECACCNPETEGETEESEDEEEEEEEFDNDKLKTYN